MDAAALERVYGAFQDFHAYFSPHFGRRESRERSRDYLQALLVQGPDRRNAENLSEAVGVSARSMQRFLTEAPWDDDGVMGRLQEYLGSRLEHLEVEHAEMEHALSVWVVDGSDFPKQGVKSVGGGTAVLRPTGEGGQLPGWDVPGLRQPAGSGVGGQAAVPAGGLDLG